MKLKLLLLTIPNIAAKTKVLRAPRTFLLRYMNFAIKHLSLTISKAIGDFFASAGNCRSVSTTLAGTTNRFLNKRVNSLFCACAPIVNIQWTVWQRGQISQETESMTFAVVLPEQLLENNKEKKARIFSGVKKRVDIFSRSYVKRRCKLITRTNSSGQTCWPLKKKFQWEFLGPYFAQVRKWMPRDCLSIAVAVDSR